MRATGAPWSLVWQHHNEGYRSPLSGSITMRATGAPWWLVLQHHNEGYGSSLITSLTASQWGLQEPLVWQHHNEGYRSPLITSLVQCRNEGYRSPWSLVWQCRNEAYRSPLDVLPVPSFCDSGPSLISFTYKQLIPDTPSRTHLVCFNVMRLADDKERDGCAVRSFFLCLRSFFN